MKEDCLHHGVCSFWHSRIALVPPKIEKGMVINMHTAGNLIKMDLYKLMSTGKVLILFVLGTLILSGGVRNTSVGFMLGLYMWIYSPWSYDEQSQGEYLTGTLPVTRQVFVQAKFLYNLLGLFVVLLINRLGGESVSVMKKINNEAFLDFSPFTLLFLGAIFISITLPIVLYFGITKARYIVMLFYIVPIVLSGAAASIFEDYILSYQKNTSLWMLLGSGIILIVSYMVSVRLYAKREFL